VAKKSPKEIVFLCIRVPYFSHIYYLILTTFYLFCRDLIFGVKVKVCSGVLKPWQKLESKAPMGN